MITAHPKILAKNLDESKRTTDANRSSSLGQTIPCISVSRTALKCSNNLINAIWKSQAFATKHNLCLSNAFQLSGVI